ncbi:MAG: addiction module toxin, HicA family [candidate division Zixibacteria bacterium]|nr:addiction module toxin, HicA family [candidate division Zixibacteria bacterium]
MTIRRRDLIRHLEKHGYSLLLREGGRHSIYYKKGQGTIPIKRHKDFDRITAIRLCKQAKIPPIGEE